MKIKKKHPYEEPALMVVCVASVNVFAVSGTPEVRTTSEKASTDCDALVKGQNSNDIWDEEW